MDLIWALFSVFATALAAPLVIRLLPRSGAALLTIVPLASFCFFTGWILGPRGSSPWSLRFPWVPSLGIELSFFVDGLSLLFLLLVTGIGALVVLYASAYLKDHPRQGFFFFSLFLFMGSMLGLVVSGDFVLMFVFWELTSLASFLLVGFDSEREAARRGALQALLVTGGGGLALLAGGALLAGITGSWSIPEAFAKAEAVRAHPLATPTLMLLLAGAFTKSAQVPFHFWLPNAMAAPTPVSAYLHSATMVKAGVFLLARMFPIWGETGAWQLTLGSIGALTALTGSVMALKQTDLKRLLAYSTVGSLGMLVLLLGVGSPDAVQAALVYLVVHSLYKGALFMVAGTVDHETGTRDVSGLAGLGRVMPLTAAAAILASLSMAGFPPLLGFIGKELVYQAKIEVPEIGMFLAAIGVLANMMMVAVAFFVGLEPFAGSRVVSPRRPHEAEWRFIAGPLALAFLGVVIGIWPGDFGEAFLTGAASAVWGAPNEVILKTWHGWNLVLFLSLLTVAGGVFFYFQRAAFRGFGNRIARIARWGPDRAYGSLLKATVSGSARLISWIQTGRLSGYLLVVAASTAALLAWAFLTAGPPVLEPRAGGGWDEVMLTLLICSAAVAASLTSSRLLSICCMGVIGFSIAVLYAIYSAPDVAITQILVETLSVILTVFLVSRLPALRTSGGWALRSARALVASALGLGMGLVAFFSLHADRTVEPVSSYFVENSLVEAKGANVVNVILVDFRALDTLGEITVLAVAALGVASLLAITGQTEERRTT